MLDKVRQRYEFKDEGHSDKNVVGVIITFFPHSLADSSSPSICPGERSTAHGSIVGVIAPLFPSTSGSGGGSSVIKESFRRLRGPMLIETKRTLRSRGPG
jgi:hypothetical protein